MTKTHSILILLVTSALVAVAAWILSRPNESDVYFPALTPIVNSSAVLTSEPSTCRIGSSPVAGMPPELVASFLAANGPSAKPISLAELNESFAIASSAKVNSYAKAGVSVQALLRGDRNVLSLSRVGFNEDHSEALFCAEGQNGGLFHTRIQNGQWHLVNFATTWTR